jgi:hypothetical protein
MIKISLILTLYFSVGTLALYAPPSPPAGGGTPACWPPPCIPVDGGIGILLVAGAALGAKEAYRKFKN